MKIKTFQILNILGLIAVIIVNYLANALPIAGKTTGALSDLYPSIFTPAGVTFAIWGLIYLLLIIFLVYQSKGLFKESNIVQNRYLYRIDVWFFVSSIANVSWIFAWHHQIVWLSMVIMLVMLFSLIMIYTRLGIGQRVVGNAERFMVHLPFSVYLGWITVATIANAATVFIRYNWQGFGIVPETWTVIMISIAAIISVIIMNLRKDIFYSLVIIWALAGIIYKRIQPGEELYINVVIAAVAGIAVILLFIILHLMKVVFKRAKIAS